MKIAEYIWIDGSKPTPQLRSKTKVLENDEKPPIWGFDGSSTNQAIGEASDCVLNPVFSCVDPLRYPGDILVMCEVLNTDYTPHDTNTRHQCLASNTRHDSEEGWFGIEQEYTLLWNHRPLGFPDGGYPSPQGQYYCSVGANNAFGRKIAEEHLRACLTAKLSITGINAEVCPGQWEFQIGGPNIDAISASDQLWVARWLLHRIAEKHGVVASLAPKPIKGDWNGAGCHTNFSTREMRESYAAIKKSAMALQTAAAKHIKNYGHDIENRLTGDHETCSYTEFKWGVSDRGASLRIPWQCAKNDGGYLEDRRPNANCDPYVVTQLILDTICLQNEV